METVGVLLLFLIGLFQLVLVVRIIVEMIHSFSRQFNPPRWFYPIAEPLFRFTDPPVKALRRIIPPLRMGGVALDISATVLFIIIQLISLLVTLIFFPAPGIAV